MIDSRIFPWKKIIMVALVVVLILATIVLIYYKVIKKPAVEIGPDGKPIEIIQTKQFEVQTPELSQEQIEQNKIKNLALDFAERFGTYSNQGGESIVEELKVFMTDNFYRWADSQYTKQLESEYNNDGQYASVVTQALAVEFIEYNASQAEVMVSTNRIKNKSEAGAYKVQEDLRLKLVKLDENWEIDGAYWGE